MENISHLQTECVQTAALRKTIAQLRADTMDMRSMMDDRDLAEQEEVNNGVIRFASYHIFDACIQLHGIS